MKGCAVIDWLAVPLCQVVAWDEVNIVKDERVVVSLGKVEANVEELATVELAAIVGLLHNENVEAAKLAAAQKGVHGRHKLCQVLLALQDTQMGEQMSMAGLQPHAAP